jgi:hypothetical protein
LLNALSPEDVERFRPLLPVGYCAVAEAYRRASQSITASDLTEHYTSGLASFHAEFVPWLRGLLSDLSGGHWQLDDYVAFASGSDVDLMTHLIEAVAARESVCLFPGDWFGFLVGSTHQDNIVWRSDATDSLGCLCIPSVRNGHVTDEMYDFLESSTSCLLNLNLYPTLAAEERHSVSARLAPLLPKSLLSISFSRGFGLTASQLGVFLVHKEHPYRSRFEQQWNWLTYFHNSIAVRTLLALNLDDLQAVDTRRRTWVSDWLQDHGLPAIASGSYYVKSFLTDRDVPQHLQPLVRDGLLRLCFKPPITMIEVGRTEGAKNRRGLSRASPSSVHS